jgi:metal-responsive CopG/Arc/MetJ family transcriptional regulator
MKTAVSIPDEVFAEAERLASELQTSRSQLYSRALQEFVARHAPERLTEAISMSSAGVPHAECSSKSSGNQPRRGLVG